MVRKVVKRFRASVVVVSWVFLELSFRVSFAFYGLGEMGMKIVSQFDGIVEMEYRLLRVWVFKTRFQLQSLLLPEWRIGRRPGAKKRKRAYSIGVLAAGIEIAAEMKSRFALRGGVEEKWPFGCSMMGGCGESLILPLQRRPPKMHYRYSSRIVLSKRPKVAQF
jgi:hypothetical protein